MPLRLAALPPFRLDLTANALRRLSTNAVDVFSDGRYRRAFSSGTVLEVTSPRANAVEARLVGGADDEAAALVRRMFGIDRDLRSFYRAVRGTGWLEALATRMRGVKPPRYPTVWEAIVNAVAFQQVSLAAASAILRRVVERLGVPVEHAGERLYAFPDAARVGDAAVETLRGCGLSAGKAVALRTLGAAVADGTLDEAALEPLPTDEVLTRLVALRGIGPWTAAVVALRGLGRLDVFPLRDSGVARNLRTLSGEAVLDATELCAGLGAFRGMLYYHLLLGSLEARGLLDASGGPASRNAPPTSKDDGMDSATGSGAA